MTPDETMLAAAEKLVGECAYRAKLDGRSADYRAACAADDQASSRDTQQAIDAVQYDLAYIQSKMQGDGIEKPAEEQQQSKAWREAREVADGPGP